MNQHDLEIKLKIFSKHQDFDNKFEILYNDKYSDNTIWKTLARGSEAKYVLFLEQDSELTVIRNRDKAKTTVDESLEQWVETLKAGYLELEGECFRLIRYLDNAASKHKADGCDKLLVQLIDEKCMRVHNYSSYVWDCYKALNDKEYFTDGDIKIEEIIYSGIKTRIDFEGEAIK